MKISLRAKTVLVVMIVVAIIASMAIVFSYTTYANTMDDHYKSLTTNVAKTAASQMDPVKIEKYVTTLEKDEHYDECLQTLFEIKECNDVLYLYIQRFDEHHITFIMDADTSEEAYQFGETHEYTEGVNLYALKDGIPAVISNSDEGWLCSAFEPIMNDKGEVLAMVGVDISMDDVMNDRHEFLFLVCLTIIISTIIAVVALILLISKFIITPINSLSKAAESFVSEQTSKKLDGQGSAISALNIKSKDEIGNLTQSIKTMEKDIISYIQNITAITAEKERISAELNVATEIQASMLPCIFPAFPDRKEFDIYATMQPAKEVGGDFYDFFMVDEDHLAVVVADVSGKGVPAALFMVIAKTLIRNQTQSGHSPADVFTSVNEQLCENNEAGMFVTAWMGVLEISTGKFTYVNAGHNPPLIKRAGEKFEYLKSRSAFVLAGMDGVKYRQAELVFNKGDMLYLYTDGVTEATSLDQELYGEDRLKNILDKNVNNVPKDILHEVKKDIDLFVDKAPQFDDITMLALEIKGGV